MQPLYSESVQQRVTKERNGTVVSRCWKSTVSKNDLDLDVPERIVFQSASPDQERVRLGLGLGLTRDLSTIANPHFYISPIHLERRLYRSPIHLQRRLYRAPIHLGTYLRSPEWNNGSTIFRFQDQATVSYAIESCAKLMRRA